MRPPDSWSKARVTLALTIVTAAVHLLAELSGFGQEIAEWGAFIPADVGIDLPLDRAPLWLTPLTSAFLHQTWLHLGLNLLILVFCGRPTEAVLGPIGFAILYVVGAYAAAAAQYAVDPASLVAMIGASGAVSAVLGAYAILFGRNRVRVRSLRLARWLNALWLLAAWVVLQLIVGITFESVGILVAIAAHIGGFAVGLLLANPLLLLRYRKA